MSAVLITGGSGSGKTSVAAALAQRGLLSLDTDADPELARFVDSAGRVVARPAEPDFDWLARHRWEWNLDHLAQLLAAAPRTLFVCGNASNETDVWDRFEHVFLLTIDEPTMVTRLDDPSRDNDFGRVGDTRDQLRKWLPHYQARMRAQGALPIDASLPLNHVVDAILAQTPARLLREVP